MTAHDTCGVFSSVRVDDCGGYFQAYAVYPKARGPRGGSKKGGMEVKLGNVYPPGFELFGEVFSATRWVADHPVFGRKGFGGFWAFSAALAYLLSHSCHFHGGAR